MNEDNKHNEKLIWQDFLNYLTRQFTNHEKHYFERKVDKSAFDTEALEGLEKFAGASMDNDIELLKDHINKRNTLFDPKPKRGFPIKSIAAIALLVIGSGIVISLLLNKQDFEEQQITQNESVINNDSILNVSTITVKDSNAQLAQNIAKNTQQKEQANQREEIEADDNEKLIITGSEEQIKIKAEPVFTNADSELVEEDEPLAMTDTQKRSPIPLSTSTIEKVKEQSSRANIDEQAKRNENLIHPTKGDSVFAKELKQWLKDEGLANEGEIQVNLVFKKSNSANNVIIIKGITEEANKAIQFYIMNKTLWLDQKQDRVNEGEFVYSFQL